MTTMHAKDTLSGAMAECLLTIGDDRYNFMQAIKIEAKFDKTKKEVPILGRTGKGNKSTGWKGTGTAQFHYNTTIFRELLQKYKNLNTDIYFDMQIKNEDKTSTNGSQIITLKDCNIDGGILAKFDAQSDFLEESMSFTFEDFEIGKSFDTLAGMII